MRRICISAFADGSDRELGPVCHSEFVHDAADVHLYGGLRHAELTRDYLVRLSLTEQYQNFILLGGEDRTGVPSVENCFSRADVRQGGGREERASAFDKG